MQINLLDYLENTAAAFPDKVAFSDDKEEITFSQLVKRSKAVGSCISTLCGGKIRRPVIVPVNHTVNNVVAFMGVLYSGNCYVPIDQNLPEERVRHIMAVTEPLAQIIFAQDENVLNVNLESAANLNANLNANLESAANPDSAAGSMSSACNRPVKVPFLKAASWDADNATLACIRDRAIDMDPAYILFTSGTTGTPKGTVISHRAVIDLTEWLTNTFDFTCESVFGCQTPYYFDASVKELYITLKTGAHAHLIAKKWFSFPLKLFEIINEKKIDTILWATSAISLIASSGAFEKQVPDTIKKVFFAGETMHSKYLNIWQAALPDAMYVNLYGPTEATVDCAFYIVNRKFVDSEPIPIGKPCRNMDVFLLDKNDRQIIWNGDAGPTGEICIRGTGVSFGYYLEPEKTEQSFVQNPLNPYYQEKIYRTGDFGRYNNLGEIVFISRRDGQIKHMGNRIELGDIENALHSLSFVKAGVCLYDKSVGKIVCIYQVDSGGTSDKSSSSSNSGTGNSDTNDCNSSTGNSDANDCNSSAGSSGSAKDVMTGLQKYLPKYMLPNILIKLDDLPYTSNGKIDRTWLLENYTCLCDAKQ